MSEHPSPEPCPFCGKLPKVMPSNPKEDGNAWGAVRCVNLKCPAMPQVSDGVGVADGRGSKAYNAAAVARWNACATPAPSDHVKAALKLAIEHIEHMAAFIGALKAGYSFESLGEDMPEIKAALSPSKSEPQL